jgi:FixJ family two-component response regulator
VKGLNRTIAVIDDDACVRKAFGRLLRAAGFEITAYASAQEFLDAGHDPLPDCAVLDMHMPGLSGLELQQRLRDLGVCLPMIVITADGRACQASLDAGAVAYLRKPVDGPMLIGCIERAIATAPQRAQLARIAAGAR